MPSINRFSPANKLIQTFCLIGCLISAQPAIAEITPNEVYAQAVQIEKEIELMKRHYNITALNQVSPVETDLRPDHVWRKSYVILFKLNIFRRKHGLIGITPVEHEPALDLAPILNWGQMQRILTEIRIIKTYLNIPGEASPATPVQGKRPIDVFNKLNQIAYDMDTLNGEPISPSYVYAEIMRINEDINTLLRKTGTLDFAVPPPRNQNATPKDALAAAFSLMGEIQRIQHRLGLEATDFEVFRKSDHVVPSDVFNMVTLCLAEIQRIKNKLGMKHVLTAPAEYHEGKTPVDTTQLLGYMTQKLHLINKGI